MTGLDPALVRRYHGRLDTDVFLHELERAQGRVGSQYDATIANADPFPHRALSDYPDPVLEGFKAPVTGAMVAIYAEQSELAAGRHLSAGQRQRVSRNGTGAAA